MSRILIAISAFFLVLGLPIFAQGQGGGQWTGQAGSFDMSAMQERMVDRAVESNDTDDDGELSKEEFLELASNEWYSSWFEETESADEESEDEDAEASEEDEATNDEAEGEEESDEDALAKHHEAKFEEIDADDDGKVTAKELMDSIDFEAVMERARERRGQGGGQRGQGGGNWQRPGGGG